jgi:hypothetical protein
MAATAIDNAERDLTVQNREAKTAKKVVVPDAEERLHEIRRRIKVGLNLVGKDLNEKDPRPKDAPICKECFQRGWMAALRSLED